MLTSSHEAADVSAGSEKLRQCSPLAILPPRLSERGHSPVAISRRRVFGRMDFQVSIAA